MSKITLVAILLAIILAILIFIKESKDDLHPIVLKDKSVILAMIKLIKQSGAEVLLVGVPDFSLFGFDTHEVYSEVVQEIEVIFEDEVLTYIELHRAYKSDYIHPNEKGYELMADAFMELLKNHKMLL